MTEAHTSETAQSEETRSTSPRASLVGGDEDGSETGREVAAGAREEMSRARETMSMSIASREEDSFLSHDRSIGPFPRIVEDAPRARARESTA